MKKLMYALAVALVASTAAFAVDKIPLRAIEAPTNDVDKVLTVQPDGSVEAETAAGGVTNDSVGSAEIQDGSIQQADLGFTPVAAFAYPKMDYRHTIAQGNNIPTNGFYIFDTSGGNLLSGLPDSAAFSGQVVGVKITTGTGTLRINVAPAAQQVDGSTFGVVITGLNASAGFYADGTTNWYTLWNYHAP